jgi:uridine kinase
MPTKDVILSFPNGTKETWPFGTRPVDLVGHFEKGQWPLAAVLLNNELSSTHARIEVNSSIAPVSVDSPEGAQVYRRSLCLLLAIAARELFPARRLVVGHSLSNGYYYSFDDGAELGTEAIAALRARMAEIVEADEQIHFKYIAYADALEHFRHNDQPETALLLEHINPAKVPVHECRDFMDLYVTPMVPSTGILKTFELMPYQGGLLLRYPNVGEPDRIAEFEDMPLLFSVYRESKRWGKILGVTSVGALNKANMERRVKDFIQVAEALQNKKIAEIADRVAERRGARVVLIAGPSSSGKTTFSKKLGIELRVLGFEPLTIGLDDYFVDRERTPRDEKGEPDYECLEALDVEKLNRDLVALMGGQEIELPTFDFKAGRGKPSGKKLRMGPESIIVMEGIHGLNDRLTPLVPRENKFKVYVSALTQLNLDDHNRVPTTDNRILRRMVRDYQFRGHSALATLRMWPSVQRGERKHIFPFQNGADAAFNSALDYELAVLKIYAEPLLKTVKPMEREYAEAQRLLSFLENFAPIPAQYVPAQSIVREFIGESEFKY